MNLQRNVVQIHGICIGNVIVTVPYTKSMYLCLQQWTEFTVITWNVHQKQANRNRVSKTVSTYHANRPFQYTSPFCVTWRLHFTSFASATVLTVHSLYRHQLHGTICLHIFVVVLLCHSFYLNSSLTFSSPLSLLSSIIPYSPHTLFRFNSFFSFFFLLLFSMFVFISV